MAPSSSAVIALCAAETASSRIRYRLLLFALTITILLPLIGGESSSSAGETDSVHSSSSIDATSTGTCRFPRAWTGAWFEGGGVGDVMITSTAIDGKGNCIENANDFYIMEHLDSRSIVCYICLQIVERHSNLLQYKQSICYGQEAKDRICKTIHPETIQKTLIRIPPTEIPCPFQGSYHFIYTNNSGGQCRQPTSYMASCASQSNLLVKFRHCSDAAYTYEREVQLHCLAGWREGANTFLLGRLVGPDLNDRDLQYRCLLYQVFGNVIYAAMSADASCRGLVSPTDGPVKMEFTEDFFGSHQSHSCTFPSWINRHPSTPADPQLTSTTADPVRTGQQQYQRRGGQDASPLPPLRQPPTVWRDLAGIGVTYEAEESGDIIRRRNSSSAMARGASTSRFGHNSPHPSSSPESYQQQQQQQPQQSPLQQQQQHSTGSTLVAGAVQSFRCLHGRAFNVSTSTSSLSTAAGGGRGQSRHADGDAFVAMTLVHNICSTSYQCLTFIRRGEGVIELHEGRHASHHSERCPESINSPTPPPPSTGGNQINHFLISNTELPTQVSRCPPKGRYTIHTGVANCTSYFQSDCSAPNMVEIGSSCSSKPGLQLECLKTWREGNNRQYLIATLPGNKTPLANCFVFRMKPDSMTMTFSLDSECNRGVPNLSRDRATYLMKLHPISCETPTSVEKFLGPRFTTTSPTAAVSPIRTNSSKQHGFGQSGSGSVTSHKVADGARQSREKAWPISNSISSTGSKRLFVTDTSYFRTTCFNLFLSLLLTLCFIR